MEFRCGIRADRRMPGYSGLRLQEMQKMLPQGRLRIRGEVRRGLSFAAPKTPYARRPRWLTLDASCNPCDLRVSDEYCPHCDNHFVIEAKTPQTKTPQPTVEGQSEESEDIRMQRNPLL